MQILSPVTSSELKPGLLVVSSAMDRPCFLTIAAFFHKDVSTGDPPCPDPATTSHPFYFITQVDVIAVSVTDLYFSWSGLFCLAAKRGNKKKGESQPLHRNFLGYIIH